MSVYMKNIDLCIEEEQEELVESGGKELFSKDEVANILEEILPFARIDLENVQDMKLDAKEFAEGIKMYSKECGKIAALLNVGVPIEQAIEYLLIREGKFVKQFKA